MMIHCHSLRAPEDCHWTTIKHWATRMATAAATRYLPFDFRFAFGFSVKVCISTIAHRFIITEHDEPSENCRHHCGWALLWTGSPCWFDCRSVCGSIHFAVWFMCPFRCLAWKAMEFPSWNLNIRLSDARDGKDFFFWSWKFTRAKVKFKGKSSNFLRINQTEIGDWRTKQKVSSSSSFFLIFAIVFKLTVLKCTAEQWWKFISLHSMCHWIEVSSSVTQAMPAMMTLEHSWSPVITFAQCHHKNNCGCGYPVAVMDSGENLDPQERHQNLKISVIIAWTSSSWVQVSRVPSSSSDPVTKSPLPSSLPRMLCNHFPASRTNNDSKGDPEGMVIPYPRGQQVNDDCGLRETTVVATVWRAVPCGCASRLIYLVHYTTYIVSISSHNFATSARECR